VGYPNILLSYLIRLLLFQNEESTSIPKSSWKFKNKLFSIILGMQEARQGLLEVWG
jgi:hypothetical protein